MVEMYKGFMITEDAGHVDVFESVPAHDEDEGWTLLFPQCPSVEAARQYIDQELSDRESDTDQA